jgi:hypothetical protein
MIITKEIYKDEIIVDIILNKEEYTIIDGCYQFDDLEMIAKSYLNYHRIYDKEVYLEVEPEEYENGILITLYFK